MLEKDALFARLNLKHEELKLYEQIYDHLKPQAPAPDLVDRICSTLRDAGADPTRLCLEITEGSVIKDFDATLPILNARSSALAEEWLGRVPGRDVRAVYLEHRTRAGEAIAATACTRCWAQRTAPISRPTRRN